MKNETNLFKIEACIGTLQSGIEAEKGGGNRVELCDNLAEGGTTPSAALIQMTKEKLEIPAAVMIRPRHGDFLYSDLEFEIMKKDIEFCKTVGVEAVVFGLLTPDGQIDCQRTMRLVESAGNMQVCFHRAVDLSRDYFEAIEQIINCGCTRILTSGGANKAVEGFENIRKAQELYGNKIEIMFGSGINAENVSKFHSVGIRNFHLSGKVQIDSLMTYRKEGVSMGAISAEEEYKITQTDYRKIEDVKKVLETKF
jgi:copper homeostasis protein